MPLWISTWQRIQATQTHLECSYVKQVQAASKIQQNSEHEEENPVLATATKTMPSYANYYDESPQKMV